MDVEELVAALAPLVPRSLIALDFDGTLAPIVPNPAESRPAQGAVAALRSLAGRGAKIAVVTGRDALTVLALGGLDAVPGLLIQGLYGAETWQDGRLRTLETPEAVARLRRRLPSLLDAGGVDERVWIEDKRLSLVVHGDASPTIRPPRWRRSGGRSGHWPPSSASRSIRVAV
jgi:trehalose 6-phosphate phosphatase